MDVIRPFNPSRLRLKRVFGGVAAALLVGSLVFAWRRTSSAASPLVATHEQQGATWTEKVERGDLLRQVPVQGTLVPEHVQWLSAATAARVAHIHVRPGTPVEADAIVLTLENTDLELAALEAERQAASAEARLIELDVKTTSEEKQQATAVAALRADLREADRHAGDATRLGKEGLVSEIERRDAVERVTGINDRFGTEQARHEVIITGRAKQLTAQRAEITRLQEIATFRRKQLAALEVRAGVRGVVQDIPLENGQWVAIGTMLAKIAEPGRLKADVKVAESYARDVHKGLAVRFEGANLNCRGKIERVDPSVIGGSVKLEITLDDPAIKSARADQNVSGYIEIEKLENVLHVARPAGAVDGASVSVYRVDPQEDGAFATRINSVQLGRGSARDVEVVSGLEAGDRIITSDTSTWEQPRVRLK